MFFFKDHILLKSELKLDSDSASHALVWPLKKNHQQANYLKPAGFELRYYIGKIIQFKALKEKIGIILERLWASNVGSSNY